MQTTLVILFFVSMLATLLWYFKQKNNKSEHLRKPVNSSEQAISNEFIHSLINSEYAKTLAPLKIHVKGHRVITSMVGNAGFILNLDANYWASAYRNGNSILSDFGTGEIPEKSINNINSTDLGDASISIMEDKPYSNEPNNIKGEVEKSHDKVLSGIAIGNNTFNFAFESGMELDFQFCTDKNGKPAIRVFWEQW